MGVALDFIAYGTSTRNVTLHVAQYSCQYPYRRAKRLERIVFVIRVNCIGFAQESVRLQRLLASHNH